MKYQIGDLFVVKDINPHPLPRPRRRSHPLPRPHPRPLLHLQNTLGVIVTFEKHSDIFESDSTESDNGYNWYSQVDGREYYFYENEVEGEVVA